MWSACSAVQYRRRERFNGNNLHVGVVFLKSFADTGNGSSRAHTSHEDVHLTLSLLPNLHTGSLIVALRICLVFKLLQNDGTGDRLFQLVCRLDGSSHSILSGSELHLGSVGLHKVSSFDAHCLRHCQNQFVALYCRNESQSHAGVSACRLNDCCARFQNPFLLSILNHSQCYAVFHASAGVEIFHFGNNRCVYCISGRESVQFQQRRPANKVGKSFCYHTLVLPF